MFERKLVFQKIEGQSWKAVVIDPNEIVYEYTVAGATEIEQVATIKSLANKWKVRALENMEGLFVENYDPILINVELLDVEKVFVSTDGEMLEAIWEAPANVETMTALIQMEVVGENLLEFAFV